MPEPSFIWGQEVGRDGIDAIDTPGGLGPSEGESLTSLLAKYVIRYKGAWALGRLSEEVCAGFPIKPLDILGRIASLREAPWRGNGGNRKGVTPWLVQGVVRQAACYLRNFRQSMHGHLI